MKGRIQMKKKLTAIIAIVLIIATIAAPSALALGGLKASNYFNAYSASISKSSTTITINFSVTATGTMTTLGVSSIKIYYVNSSNEWELVATLTGSTTSGLTGSNRAYYSSSATYTGVAGRQYYAKVEFYAANSSGTGSRSYSTNSVTL
jgi:hypothetical protein